MEKPATLDPSTIEIKKRQRQIILGAAFLTATTNIGPGFLTQTALFGSQLLGAFFFVIVAVALLDITTQATTYRMCCFTGKRAQDIANDLKPGLGYVVSALVMFGIFIFQLGNVGGTALGVRTLLHLDGVSHSISIIIAGCIAILVFAFKNFNPIIDQLSKILGLVMIAVTLVLAFTTKPPVGNIFPQFLAADKTTLIFPMLTLLGGAAGGYSSLIAPHRLLGRGLSGKNDWVTYKSTLKAHMSVVYIMRLTIFLVTFGVVSAGAVIDPSDPARSAFEAGAGILGRYIFGLVIFAAGLTTVIGAAVTLVSMIATYNDKILKYERQICIAFIAFATIVMATIGQPAAMLVAAGSINGLILPLIMAMLLITSRSKRVMGEDYKHPLILTIGGIVVVLMSGYFGAVNFPKILQLFA